MNILFERRQEQLKTEMDQFKSLDKLGCSGSVLYSFVKGMRELNYKQAKRLEEEPFWRYFSVLHENMDHLDHINDRLNKVKTCNDLAILTVTLSSAKTGY